MQGRVSDFLEGAGGGGGGFVVFEVAHKAYQNFC